jgi:hypothetical protein
MQRKVDINFNKTRNERGGGGGKVEYLFCNESK